MLQRGVTEDDVDRLDLLPAIPRHAVSEAERLQHLVEIALEIDAEHFLEMLLAAGQRASKACASEGSNSGEHILALHQAMDIRHRHMSAAGEGEH